MNRPNRDPFAVTVGVIGEYDPDRPSHPATNAALNHAATTLDLQLETVWLPTLELAGPRGEQMLRAVDGLWAAPGADYASPAGAHRAIRFCRENDWPFIAT